MMLFVFLTKIQDPGDESERNKGREMSADEGMLSLNPVEMQYMEGWNDVMYSSLRRRNAVRVPRRVNVCTRERVCMCARESVSRRGTHAVIFTVVSSDLNL